MGFKRLLLASLLSFFATNAAAREDFVLQMGNQEFNGASTIRLKMLLQEQYGIRANDYELVGVRMVAKSQFGRGSARLTVGDWSSHSQRIDGHPATWNDSHPRTYARLDFGNESWRQNGPWQLQLNGNIKIQRIVVSLSRSFDDGFDDGHPGGHHRQSMVTCFSNGHALQQCPVQGQIIGIQIVNQISIAPCVEGRSFGTYQGGIWVRGGCRATFQVTTAGF
ncbi:MAG: DUF3011 domain-containing protein [Bdellovibrio sp.]|jgi:hypothetical protein